MDSNKSTFTAQLNFNPFCYNVNEVQSSKKRTKLFEYFRNKIAPKGILFLRETHSNKEEEKKWCDDLNGQIHFSHGKTNSCGVLIAFLGVPNYYVKSEISDNAGRILILEVEIDGIYFLLVNFYNANTETEQLKIIQNLSTLLNNLSIIMIKMLYLRVTSIVSLIEN